MQNRRKNEVIGVFIDETVIPIGMGLWIAMN